MSERLEHAYQRLHAAGEGAGVIDAHVGIAGIESRHAAVETRLDFGAALAAAGSDAGGANLDGAIDENERRPCVAPARCAA